jgi:hypothetical protein
MSKNIRIRVCKTIILAVVLYGCEILSVTLREELILRVCVDRVLRRIFGGKRKLNNEELHDLYSSQSIMRMTE